ncbi:MAG TPA: septal ring lytic transglycosylase RlpA family protein [Roseomonas sp.]|jgi:rare lipoprotein A
MGRAILAAVCFAISMSPVAAEAASKEPSRNHSAQAQPEHSRHLRTQRGRASFYSSRFHGRRMANGKRFNRHSNSAASRTLPLGTQAQVKNLENGRTAVVVIQDRGPHLRGRVLDVSPRTADMLGMREQGTALVEITPLTIPRDSRG